MIENHEKVSMKITKKKKKQLIYVTFHLTTKKSKFSLDLTILKNKKESILPSPPPIWSSQHFFFIKETLYFLTHAKKYILNCFCNVIKMHY